MASSNKSNWFYSKIEQIDFLGEEIKFTINNQPHFKTFCGGVLRLFLYLIGIFLFIFFGKDFIFKLNPRIYYEVKETLEDYEINYTAKDFFFAIRFENYFGKNLNITDYFYITATYTQISFDKNIPINDGVKNIQMVSCAEVEFDPETEYLFKSKPLTIKSEYFCPLIPKDSNITILGNLQDFKQKYWFFDLNLKLCLDIENKNNKNCKNYKKFFNEFSKSEDIYVQFMINDIKFDKDDLENPLKRKFSSLSNLLSNNLVKHEYFYLSKTNLIEDNGFIFVSENNYTEFGLSKYERDFRYFDNISSDDEIKPIINDFYTIQISADNKYKYYTRKYMKFQDVLALLGSFMNLMVLITKSVYALYYRVKLSSYFFERFIRIDGFSKSKNFNNDLMAKLNKNDELNSTDTTIRRLNRDKTNRFDPNFINLGKNLNLNIESFDGNKRESKLEVVSYCGGDFVEKAEKNNKNELAYIRKSSIARNNDIYHNINLRELSKKQNENFVNNNENDKNNTTFIKDPELEPKLKHEKNLFLIYDSISKEKNGVKFSFWENLKQIFRKNKVTNDDYYVKSENFSKLLLNKFDVFYYLRKMRNLSLMKKCLLEENQLNMLNFISNKYYSLENNIKFKHEHFKYTKNAFDESVAYLTDNRHKSLINKILLEDLFKDN